MGSTDDEYSALMIPGLQPRLFGAPVRCGYSTLLVMHSASE